jgi:hypothetical protein
MASENEYVIDWDTVYAKALPMNAVGLFTYMCMLQGEGVPIHADRVHPTEAKALMDAGLVVQSGNNLRIPRPIFKFL